LKIGYETSVAQILEQVLSDKPFWDNSGGGVTITGGEPTSQKEFLLELLDVLRQLGIHCAIETCGQYPASLTQSLVDNVDLFLFDLKLMDSNLHKQYTGVENAQILHNFEKITKIAGKDRVIPRIPLIDGLNVSRNAIASYLEYLQTAGYEGEVNLMPYHRMAKAKYGRLGREQDFFETGILEETKLSEIAEILHAAGLNPIIYG